MALDPEAIAGLVAAVAAFVFGEVQLDKAKIASELDAQKLQLNNYVIQLTELVKSLQVEES
jgi:D-ribose pyranose/furanose isomerase RbsD